MCAPSTLPKFKPSLNGYFYCSYIYVNFDLSSSVIILAPSTFERSSPSLNEGFYNCSSFNLSSNVTIFAPSTLLRSKPILKAGFFISLYSIYDSA
jgi:hypothetical protein